MRRVEVMVAAVVLGIRLVSGADVNAVTDEPSAETINRTVQQVLSVPPFRSERILYQYRYRGDADGDTDAPVLPEWWFASLADIAAALARFAEVVLWAALFTALIALIVHRDRWWPRSERRARRGRREPPLATSAEPDQVEPLPADMVARARALCERGEVRAGLSVLYRGTLDRLVNARGLELADGATEEECLRALRRIAIPELVAYCEMLIRCWQRVAYAGQVPTAIEIDRLCAEWHRQLGVRQ